MEFEDIWWQYLQLEVGYLKKKFLTRYCPRPTDHFTGAGAIAPISWQALVLFALENHFKALNFWPCGK
jgi:hypothetical protein